MSLTTESLVPPSLPANHAAPVRRVSPPPPPVLNVPKRPKPKKEPRFYQLVNRGLIDARPRR